MKETLVSKIINSEWHRNGISGLGFYVTLFEFINCNGSAQSMVAVDFGKAADKATGNTCVAVLNVDDMYRNEALDDHYRGDNFADELRHKALVWRRNHKKD